MIKLSIDKPVEQEKTVEPTKTPERFAKPDSLRNVAFVSSAIGLLVGFLVASYLNKPNENDRYQEEQIVEPDKSDRKSNISKVEAAGSIFVFVYEFQTKTADQELLVRDLRSWSLINKCDFRQFDQDSKDAEPYKLAAEKTGLKSPFMAVVRDKKIVRVFDWPRDRLALDGLVK